MNSLEKRVDFSRIRYANCWEDAGMLLDGLRPTPEDRILIIASAGDNALALLSRGPEYIRAVDLSLQQLFLCELKQAAFSALDYDALLILLGVQGDSGRHRWMLFKKLQAGLSTGAARFWDERRNVIESGVIHHGKFERYFRLFRNWLLPLVHSRTAVEELLRPKTDEEQARFFARAWNSIRWRLLMDLFFSKAVMGKYGRDPQFLKHVTLNVPQFIRNRSEAHLQHAAATANPFLHYIFRGSFGSCLPYYLRESNYSSIRQHIGRLHLAQEDMDTSVMQAPFSIYAASNIFEYMSAETFEELSRRWSRVITRGARLAYWNLMVPRSFSSELPGQWREMDTPQGEDNGFFYSRFLLEEKL